MKQLLKYSSIAAAALLCFNANAGTVDLFSTSQALITDSTTGNGGLGSTVGAGDPTILGGNRDIFVELLTQSASAPASSAQISVLGGALSFSVGSLATGRAIVQWDGATNGNEILDVTGLGGFDLTNSGGANGFRIDTLFSDLGFAFEIQAYTSATQFTIINFSSSGVAVPTSSFIPFAGFTNAAFCGAVNPVPGVNSITCGSGNTSPVNFASLGALALVVDPLGGSISVDLTLDSVTTVPEPGSVALVGAALLGLFATKRRRDAAKK